MRKRNTRIGVVGSMSLGMVLAQSGLLTRPRRLRTKVKPDPLTDMDQATLVKAEEKRQRRAAKRRAALSPKGDSHEWR